MNIHKRTTANNWKHISTAPMDGTVFLGRYFESFYLATYIDGEFFNLIYGTDTSTFDLCITLRLTSWMPITLNGDSVYIHGAG